MRACRILVLLLFLSYDVGQVVCAYGGETTTMLASSALRGHRYAREPRLRGPMSGQNAFKRRIRIVIDPGHGGDDFGTYTKTKPRRHEKNLTMQTSMMLKEHLERMGYTVILTRRTDVAVPLPNRVTLATRQRGHLFVSVHCNSAPSADAHGIEVFYYRPPKTDGRARESSKLAEAALHSVLQTTGAKSRGVKHGDFCVIRDATMPAILVECGFLTNDEEAEKMKNPRYLNNVARGVAEGIDAYLSKQPPRTLSSAR